ncbi:hypothetical protein [Dyadobacter bucti]|uniref:hypothetical protein n=1 Tax=Dyadobacter bucti TaxID=2572203 RepID=UPI003F713E54
MLLFSNDVYGQNILDDVGLLNIDGKREAKRELIRSLISNSKMSNVEAFIYANSHRILPVLSFVLSQTKNKYDSSKHITEYLEPNGGFIDFAMLFKRDRLVGAINCLDRIGDCGCGTCNYMPFSNKSNGQYHERVRKIISIIFERRYTLTFAVNYFRNAIFFVEDDKVFLVDMNDEIIYDPDEYVRNNCGQRLVIDFGEGRELERFCK